MNVRSVLVGTYMGMGICVCVCVCTCVGVADVYVFYVLIILSLSLLHNCVRVCVCVCRYTNKTAIELAKKLTELAPGDLNRVLFTPGKQKDRERERERDPDICSLISLFLHL